MLILFSPQDIILIGPHHCRILHGKVRESGSGTKGRCWKKSFSSIWFKLSHVFGLSMFWVNAYLKSDYILCVQDQFVVQ